VSLQQLDQFRKPRRLSPELAVDGAEDGVATVLGVVVVLLEKIKLEQLAADTITTGFSLLKKA
jgi:hypothetical protein